MKYIANHSRKRKIEMVIDAINKAKIFKQELPMLKLHNRVFDKNYDNSKYNKVYLTIKDIEDHSKNPMALEHQLQIREKNSKQYTRKTTEYEVNIDFVDNIDLTSNYKDIAKTIKDHILNKISDLNTSEIEYKFDTYSDKEWCDYFDIYKNLYGEDELKYYISTSILIFKYDAYSYTVYYNPLTIFTINIIKCKNKLKQNHLHIKLDDRLVFNLDIYV